MRYSVGDIFINNIKVIYVNIFNYQYYLLLDKMYYRVKISKLKSDWLRILIENYI